MMNLDTFKPEWASPPGETMGDILDERNLSLAEFAEYIGHTADDAKDLLNGQAHITMDVARRLERVLGGSVTFWMSREAQYRKDVARLVTEDLAASEKDWLSEIPVNDMVKFGWIASPSQAASKVTECLRYFGASSVHAWRTYYEDAVQLAAYRTSPIFASHFGAVAAWLRQGEIESKSIDCGPWDATRFEGILPKIRQLTRKKEPALFLPELRKLCAECGVAVVIVRAPKGCRASGATRFLPSTKAVLQLSFRYLSDDQFWFTFFHEAGHLILHGRDALFLEGTENSTNKEENEANNFAARILIPDESQDALRNLGADGRKVMRFARDIGVSAGVVVGQLQYLEIIPRHYLNNLKTRFTWEAIQN
jgi:HTH-type transcriptional regulator / antitoxin HigA